jgi:hypothetical protein
MTAPVTTTKPIAGIDVSDEKLLRRAIVDASEAMAKYFTAGRSTREAIKAFETLRQQFDEARERVQALRSSRRPLIEG